MNRVETIKIIGVGEQGVITLDKVGNEIRNRMNLDKIFPNQDIDKDYVRNLLDGVEILFLTYNSEDKSSIQIVNAIGYMANERRILSIGLDTSKKENSDKTNIDREFRLNQDNKDNMINLFSVMLDSINDACTISIDITDLKEIIAFDKGIKYTYNEFSKNTNKEDIVKSMINSLTIIGEDFSNKKGIIMIESNSEFSLSSINEILEEIQEQITDSSNCIFSLYMKEELEEVIKIGLICN